MKANNRDAGSLWDMRQAIERIQEFTKELSYESYLESLLIQSAVERQLEILGEAARRISDEFRRSHPEIDWRRIIGLRNILIHRYDEIRQNAVWAVIVAELKPLLSHLNPLIVSLPDTEISDSEQPNAPPCCG
ncbi:MAG: DUF86 domain-containing protein [Drouetiella hepatica Uher 2000/2452]|jgi:uncharacterized protein with HEPN domain|uniref:DUF86 domain-containing protein n=1 Tax=Drouetiella hepatica Uher 2000/2452 TaxID=904376 RepID=A0A951UN91_9CYAN|nr:DUF86 domain-containing protein [Drouetiella hepatica Uher 2000/2452]